MTNINTYLLILVLAAVLINMVLKVSERRMEILEFFHFETLENIERKITNFDDSIHPQIITDEDGNVASVNKAMEKLSGLTETQFRKYGLERIIPARFWAAHQEGMRRVKGEEMEDRIYNVQMIRSNGNEIPIELLLRKKRVKEAKFFYVATFRDTTLDKIKDEQYNTEINRLKTELDILGQGEEIGSYGSWLWDLRTSADVPQTRLYTTKNYNRIMGIEDKSWHEAKFLKSRVFEPDVEIVNVHLEKVFRGETSTITYRMNRSSDFHIIYLNSTVKPICDKNGSVVLLYGCTKLLQSKNILEAIKDTTA